mgnify:CR=1 FL=1
MSSLILRVPLPLSDIMILLLFNQHPNYYFPVENMSYADIKANIDELQFLLSQSKQAGVRSLLEGEIQKQNALLKTTSPPEKKVIVKSGTRTKKITLYSWEENLKYVKVHVRDIKSAEDVIAEENIEATFKDRSFNVIVRKVGPKALNYSLAICNLNKDISPDDCKVVVTKTGLSVHLFKVKNSMWTDLKLKKGEEEKKEDIPKMNKDADPSAGLMSLMKQMYESGDDDMKRNIAKSMYEAQNKKGGEGSAAPDGGMGGMPGMGGMGGMPGMGGMGGMPGMGGMGGMPGMGAGGMGDLASMLGGMGGGGGGGLPDMGDMGAGFDDL